MNTPASGAAKLRAVRGIFAFRTDDGLPHQLHPAADTVLASAGAELAFRNGWSVAGKFDGEFAGRSKVYAGTGTVRYSR